MHSPSNRQEEAVVGVPFQGCTHKYALGVGWCAWFYASLANLSLDQLGWQGIKVHKRTNRFSIVMITHEQAALMYLSTFAGGYLLKAASVILCVSEAIESIESIEWFLSR
jgi:hypothetical protein